MDYSTLITSEHADKAKFMAMVKQVTQPLVDMQNVYSGFASLFDLSTAVGDQLDKLGEWIGASRNVQLPTSTQTFSFDTPFLGFDQGLWQSSYGQNVQFTVLSDSEYRLLLSAKVFNNTWKGSVDTYGQAGLSWDTAYQLGQLLFGPLGFELFIIDNGNLTMTIGLQSTGGVFTSLIIALLKDALLSLKPIGVGITYSFSVGVIFALDIESAVYQGLDQGNWYSVL